MSVLTGAVHCAFGLSDRPLLTSPEEKTADLSQLPTGLAKKEPTLPYPWLAKKAAYRGWGGIRR